MQAWLAAMDGVEGAARVKQEIVDALAQWESNGRFVPIIAQVQAAQELKWVFP